MITSCSLDSFDLDYAHTISWKVVPTCGGMDLRHCESDSINQVFQILTVCRFGSLFSYESEWIRFGLNESVNVPDLVYVLYFQFLLLSLSRH